MSYKYDTPEVAYKEALRRIRKAKDESATELILEGLGLTSIPLEISQLFSLKDLYLNDNKLTDIPVELARLSNLMLLNLNYNRLTTIPLELAQLSNLRVLFLRDNQLGAVPPELAQLSGLWRLNLNNNQLTTVPPELAQLTHLVELGLGGNRLTAIPSEFVQLAKLKTLVLRDNQLKAIPPELIQLSELEWLELYNNSDLPIPSEVLTRNPKAILGYNKALGEIDKTKESLTTTLNLSQLGLTTVPPEIAQLTDLVELNLNDNQLTAIPPVVRQLTKLQVLRLCDNLLTTIPPTIAQLSMLRVLNLGSNLLAVIPPEISQLTNLKELYLEENRLTAVPLELAQLTNLIVLSLSGNQLMAVPPEFAQLINLDYLGLARNQLKAVPPQFAQLSNLTEFYLNGNQLMVVPAELAQLSKLEYFNLEGNPDLPIPPEIMAQISNPQAILDYLREQQTRPLNEAKLILVGQGGVGKTSLVKRLVDNRFNPHEEQTKGIRIEKWQLDVPRPEQDTVPVTLNIWDFGGQEIMHATHQFFLTRRSLYLLVLNARQGEDEGRVEYWLSLISSFAPDAPILIIINKIDQQRLDVDRRGLQKKYPTIQGFIPTSARDDIGIDKLKTAITNTLAEMPDVDSPFPASWMRVKEELTAMQAARNFIPYTEYEQLCHEKGVAETSSQETLIRFLHDLGITLNFQDDDRVRETSVLNPNWVTHGVYALLNSPILQEARGTLRHNQLRHILPADEYPAAQRRFLLDMMLKFELAFEMPDRQSLLIPDLLSKEEPAFKWDDAHTLQFAYQYHVLPRSILHRFMVRQYSLVDPAIRWRTGVLLRYEGLSALVKADIEAKTIRITINGGGNQRQFLYSLRLVFAGIHESVAGTKPKEVVPIPGHPTAPPLLYSYLEKLEAMNMPDEQLFPGMDEVLSVQQLLNGVTTSAMRQSGLPSRQEILATLRTAFDENEFYDLLFNLGVDRKDIGGETASYQMRECVLFMERNGRLAELVAVMGEKRPYTNFRQSAGD